MTASLGFLSVRHHPEHGYFGGYLITNPNARPLEFHCTMPVKPTRAQELLYGPTIDDFVCGEQIAKALTVKARIKPTILLTDTPAVLALAGVSDLPTAWLRFESEPGSAPHLRSPVGTMAAREPQRLGKWEFSFPEGAEQDSAFASVLEQVSTNFDLTEPFQRVGEALLEAHPIAKAA